MPPSALDPLGYLSSGVPAGRSGDWVVERFEVLEDGRIDPVQASLPECGRLRAGRYSRLRCGTTVFMTDLFDEWWTQRSAIAEALARGGRMLVSGLGLGLVVEAVLRPRDSPVERVVVLERSPEVIRLVAPYLAERYGDRVEVVEADVFRWEPRGHFQVVWHDIWPDPWASSALAEAELLEARYAPIAEWQGSWPRDYRAAYGAAAATEPAA